MTRHIIIIAEQIDGKITPVTHELVAAASLLRHHTGLDIVLVTTGSESAKNARALSDKYGLDVVIVNNIHPEYPVEMRLRSLPAALFNDLNPAYVILAHSTQGLDIAPALAVKIDASCITGVEKIISANGSIGFTRSLFSDRIIQTIISRAQATVLTIAPGAFKPEHFPAPEPRTAGDISYIDPDETLLDYQHIGFETQSGDTGELNQAEVIVSAGNGIREKENLNLISELAKLFPKSAVAGSRPVCDRKWLEYNRQVGVTGATVRPKLYIACGISGASQHISGMRDARFIVAINTDPHAAIFNISDVCVVEDLTRFIPHFITTCHDSG